LAETERVLAQTIETDPLCYKIYKSTKGVVEGNISFDDRTYLRIKVR
jgi:glycerophosphoryl diester phosphodiesterase